MIVDEGIVEFRDTFLERGWRGIERDFGSCTRVNRRLIERAGGEELIALRAARNRSQNTGRTGRKSIGYTRTAEPLVTCSAPFEVPRRG